MVRLGGDAGPKFTFDQVFPLTTSQVHVFQNCVAPLVTSCLEGYNATILAYGQTGSGKTHTIMGPSSSMTSSLQNERQAGVIPRAIRSIFDQLERLQNNNGGPEEEEEKKEQPRQSYEYDVRVQFLEVYGEEIRDLLSTQQPSPKLSIRDVGMDEPEVVGATEQKVESPEEALLCLTRGMYRRVTGATAMNEESSRSHAFLSLIVEQSTEVSDIDAHCSSTSDNKTMKHVQAKRSKFNFVDLAGSERLKRTQATGRRLKEGIDINKGLLVLGNVISALGDLKKQGKTFVPYRDSKLTRLLKGSLGGNHKTLMMACVSPAANNMEETLNCLRYANRAKNIQNHAVVNLDNTSRLVADLRGKMRMLATDLLKSRSGNFDECTIPMEVVESLANGGDGEDIPRTEHRGDGNHGTPSPLRIRPRQRQEEDAPQSTGNSFIEQELQRVKAENEVFCLRIESLSKGDDPSQALQQAFIARAAEYEREIAMLRGHGGPPVGSSVYQSDFDNTIAHQNQPYLPNLPPRTPISSQSKEDPTRGLQRSDSPELNRLRAQMFGSMAQSNNLDQEVEAEEKAVAALTSKYLGKNADDGDEDDNNHENDDSHHQMAEETCTEDENLSLRFQADLYELENSIGAKEDLIQKLLVSQEKYEVCSLIDYKLVCRDGMSMSNETYFLVRRCESFMKRSSMRCRPS